MKPVASLALFLLTACGSAAETALPLDAAAGTYQLTSVNGMLPYLVSDTLGNKHYINGGQLVLDAANHEWTETLAEVRSSGSSATPGTSRLFGSYSRQGNALALTAAASLGGWVQAAEFADPRITMTQDGRALIFTKRP
jgi:hypothetical protein